MIPAPSPRASCGAGCARVVLALSLAWAAAAAGGTSAHAAEALSYTLTPLPERGRLRVEIEWKTDGRARSALGVSRQWGTLTDVPEVLGEVAVDGADSLRRQGPLWIFSHRPGATIRCRYEVDPRARTFDWSRTHHPITTARFFHGLGNAFLLVPHDEQGVSEKEFETVLRWQLPAGWKAACSWGVGRSVGQPVRAADLRNSVYLAGELSTKTVRQDGLTVDLALVEGCGLDTDEFAEMALTITRQQCAFMEETGFPPLVITAIPVGEPLKEGDTRISGTGLHNSFALFVPPRSKLDDGVEHLFAHELFHFWNGRLVQAADPERLVFWFVEGFTDYYALRILLESGRWNTATYAKWINRHLRDYHRNPAIHATNQEIQEKFWTHRDTVGEVAYQRGLLLGLRWHRRARDAGVADGVDRLLKTLVRHARQGGPKLTNDLLRSTGIETLGPWFAAEFDRFVLGAETVDVPADALEPLLSGRLRDVYEFDLGFDRERSLREMRVRGLSGDSAAARAGLREGDELAGWSIYADTERISQLKVRRGDRIETVSFYPRGRKHTVMQFSPASQK